MEESKIGAEKFRNILAGILIAIIFGYMVWAIFFMSIFLGGWHNDLDLGSYLFTGSIYILPIIIGLIIGFIAPFSSHKTYLIVITTILGFGFIIFDVFLLLRFYNAMNAGRQLVVFVVLGTIISLLFYYGCWFLSKRIRERYRKRRGYSSNLITN